MIKLYIFGEFGWINIYCLRYLALYLQHTGDICDIFTLKDYAILFKCIFGDKINICGIIELDKLNSITTSNSRSQSSNAIDALFEEKGFINMFRFLNDWISNTGINKDDIMNTTPIYRLYDISLPRDDNKVCIFPRYRKDHWMNDKKFYNTEFWTSLVSELKIRGKHIICLGDKSEILDIVCDSYEYNIIKSISHLYTCRFFITPCSGYASFAQNCNTQMIYIISNGCTDENYYKYKFFDSQYKYCNDITNDSNGLTTLLNYIE